MDESDSSAISSSDKRKAVGAFRSFSRRLKSAIAAEYSGELGTNVRGIDKSTAPSVLPDHEVPRNNFSQSQRVSSERRVRAFKTSVPFLLLRKSSSVDTGTNQPGFFAIRSMRCRN